MHPFAAFDLKSQCLCGLPFTSFNLDSLSFRFIMSVPLPDPFSQSHCVVLVLQHYYKCCASLLVFSTADPTSFMVWECPMPWHTLCFPQAYGLCTEALPGEVQMDPFTFLRNVGSWPGKALALQRKVDELMTATSGLTPVCRLFEPPPLLEMSVSQEQNIYRINFSLYPIFESWLD